MAHFTLIIPTRERQETLRWCLETCRRQDFADVRIIVSDNCSTDGTSAYLATVRDPRVEVISPGRRVSMTDNYEFAIRHALSSGPAVTYVSVLGDDDGLLPGALAYWDRVVAEHPDCQAFVWPLCYYTWPNCLDTATPNVLTCPLEHEIRRLDTDALRAGFASFAVPYTAVARVYYGLARSDAMLNVRRLDRFVHSMVPDVYLGAALTYTVDHLVSAPYPLSMVGASKHSTGHLETTGGASRDADSTSHLFRLEDNLPPHASVGVFPTSLRMCELEVLSQLRDRDFPVPALDPAAFFAAAVAEAVTRPRGKAQEILSSLASIARRNGAGWLEAWNAAVSAGVAAPQQAASQARMSPPVVLAPSGASIGLDGFSYGLGTVADAVELAAIVMGRGVPACGLGYRLRDAVRGGSAFETGNTWRAAAENACRRIATAVDEIYRSSRWRWGGIVTRPLSSRLPATHVDLDMALADLQDAVQPPEP